MQHITNTVLYQYYNFGSIEHFSNSKNVSRRRSISLPPVLLEEETCTKKPTCPKKVQIELFAKLFTAKKLQELVNEKLVTWSRVLLRIIRDKFFNIEVAKEQKMPGWTSFRKCINLKISTPTRIGTVAQFLSLLLMSTLFT